jgi:hypothetical protein
MLPGLWNTMFFATAPTITPDSGSGGSGAGTGAGAGAGAGGGAGSGAGAGTSPGTGAGAGAVPAAINWETAPAQFREGYNKLKSDLEALQGKYKPWEGLGVQPTDVQHFQQNYQQVYGEMKGIGDSLGIDEREIADSIRTHGLLPTLDQLRHEMQQSEAARGGDQAAIQQQELEARIQAIADQKLSPVLERENQRLVTAANSFVENTITQLAVDNFKAAGIDFMAAPPALKDFILTGVTEALKYDDDGMRAVKFENKSAPVQRAFQTFLAMWDGAYLARRQMEGNVRPGPPQGPPRGPQGQFAKRPSLDEIIDDPNSVRAAQGKPAYAT